MCQACVDAGEIGQETYDAIRAFLADYPDAEWGPTHIVLSDVNLEDTQLQWCLTLARALPVRTSAGSRAFWS